jgi:tRNA pseudouridine38-40 synthase
MRARNSRPSSSSTHCLPDGRAFLRLAIGIEYDGTAYNGWQRQRVGHGVQEVVERALGRVAGESVVVHGAGRTDTGVHASGQVAHFDTAARRSDRSWLLGANSNLPDDVAIRWVRPVAADFHARFCATERRYRYVILNRLVRSALLRRRVWWVHQPLDAAKMQAAGQKLLGEHDFSAFRAAGCQAVSPLRDLRGVDVSREGDFVTLELRADAFLQRMVRNITGTLVSVGRGEQTVEWVTSVLESRDRTRGGMAAPAHGLTLRHVIYPAEWGIPADVS